MLPTSWSTSPWVLRHLLPTVIIAEYFSLLLEYYGVREHLLYTPSLYHEVLLRLSVVYPRVQAHPRIYPMAEAHPWIERRNVVYPILGRKPILGWYGVMPFGNGDILSHLHASSQGVSPFSDRTS